MTFIFVCEFVYLFSYIKKYVINIKWYCINIKSQVTVITFSVSCYTIIKFLMKITKITYYFIFIIIPSYINNKIYFLIY